MPKWASEFKMVSDACSNHENTLSGIRPGANSNKAFRIMVDVNTTEETIFLNDFKIALERAWIGHDVHQKTALMDSPSSVTTRCRFDLLSQAGESEAVRTLVQWDAFSDDNLSVALLYETLIKNKNPEEVFDLIKRKGEQRGMNLCAPQGIARPVDEWMFAMAYAASDVQLMKRVGNAEVASSPLLGNAFKSSALFDAVRGTDVGLVRALLEIGASPVGLCTQMKYPMDNKQTIAGYCAGKSTVTKEIATIIQSATAQFLARAAIAECESAEDQRPRMSAFSA